MAINQTKRVERGPVSGKALLGLAQSDQNGTHVSFPYNSFTNKKYSAMTRELRPEAIAFIQCHVAKAIGGVYL